MILPATSYQLLTVRHKRGQAILSLVFLIGGIVILIATTMAFLASSFINSGYGFQAAERAAEVASSGARDGTRRLLQNKDLTGTYSVAIDTNTATVTVTQNSPAQGQVTVVSSATVSQHTRIVQVILSVSSTTGQVIVTSWQYTQ